jgi:hypothetical protein
MIEHQLYLQKMEADEQEKLRSERLLDQELEIKSQRSN